MASDTLKVRSLQQAWFGNSSDFRNAVHCALDNLGFTDQYVENVIRAARRGIVPQKDKVIKDSVWGMVEVDWQSARLLDCPIVQRLRGVKQLGFTYLTYPSAEHSRFIHSLGMYAVVQQFLDAMKKNLGPKLDGVQKYEVAPKLRQDLLHAAIMHDSGHMPFSHASEVVFAAFPLAFWCGPLTVESFRFHVDEKLEKNLQLSECLSLAILLSPRFEKFYRGYVRPGEEDEYVVSRIAALIAGLAPDENTRGPAELISTSPVDADKVDYITRDALACGIPVGIDVARLFLRSTFLRVSPHLLQSLLPGDSSEKEEVIFVVNASGVDTIEELAHARASLYQRVYLHQTTRNAERTLARCLEALPDRDTNRSPEPLRDALHLLSLDDSGLLKALTVHKNKTVQTLGTRLRNRDLPKRACVLSRTTVDMQMPLRDVFDGIPQDVVSELIKQTLGAAVQLLGNSKLRAEGLHKLENDIKVEARNLAELIRSKRRDLVPEEGEPSLVTVLPMTELKGLSKDCIVLENNELIHSSQRSISDEQSEAADIYKSLGYVLTDSEWRVIVCLAARKVIARDTETPIRETSLRLIEHSDTLEHIVNCQGRVLIDLKGVFRRAGIPLPHAQELQLVAEDVGYYDDAPSLAPCDQKFSEEITRKVKGFSGQGKWEPRLRHCERFLSQFPPKLRAPFVEAFRGFQVLDRGRVVDSLIRAFDSFRLKVGTSSRIIVTSFTPDSGNLIRMIFEQEAKDHLAQHNVIFTKTITDALNTAQDESDAVFLVDDNIGSGSQAAAQFQAWLGVPREQWPEDQQNEQGIAQTPLAPAEQEVLRNRKVGIGICFGNQAAEDGVRHLLRGLSVSNFTGIHIGQQWEHRQPTLSKELSNFLHAVGTDVLAYSHFSKRNGIAELNEAQRSNCMRDALGYGGAGWLLATPFNVPTSTFTALWCPGLYKGKPWIPLLIRRGYLKKLIIT